MTEPRTHLQEGNGSWTRQELVIMRMALAEFRVEVGPGEPELAARVDAVLRGPGERFVIVPVEDE
jgi:hypothetical protein